MGDPSLRELREGAVGFLAVFGAMPEGGFFASQPMVESELASKKMKVADATENLQTMLATVLHRLGSFATPMHHDYAAAGGSRHAKNENRFAWLGPRLAGLPGGLAFAVCAGRSCEPQAMP